jgi:rubrerythrin
MSFQTVDGIISQAIEVEKAGAAFYIKLAAEARMQAAREMFLSLAKDEVKHQRDFAELAIEIKEQGVSVNSSIDLTEVMSDTANKLQTAMRGSELVDMNEATLKQALDIGIHNEQQAIMVYSELLTIAHPGFATVIKNIIEEERRHQSDLESLKACNG